MLGFVLLFRTSPAIALPFVRVSTVVASVDTWGFIKIKIKMVIRSLMHLFHPLHHQSSRTWCSHRCSKGIERSRIWSSRFLQELCNQDLSFRNQWIHGSSYPYVSECEILEATHKPRRRARLARCRTDRCNLRGDLIWNMFIIISILSVTR